MTTKVKQYLKKFPVLYSGFQRTFYILILLPRYKIKKILVAILIPIFVKLPIKNNKIVISNFNGKGYGDNPKYIAEEILRQNLDYDIVWVLKKDLIGKEKIPSHIRIVEYRSLKHFYELATAKIWIDNDRKFGYAPKRKKQYYIQTWHGVVALKQIEKDIEKYLTPDYIAQAKNDSKMINLLLSNSKHHTDLFRRSFWYQGEILEVGAPKSEILVHQEKLKKVLNYFNIGINQSIVIYAPTFRNNKNTKVYNVDFERLIKILDKKYGGEWIVLVKLHPDMSSKADSLQYNSKILNASEYEDMNELLSASDILITDYSSSMFEFSITKKPIFLYAADVSEYIEERDFYFDIYSLPYPLAENNDQLQKVIEIFDNSRYLSELNAFLNEIEIFDPIGSSSKVVRIIRSVINQNIEIPEANKYMRI